MHCLRNNAFRVFLFIFKVLLFCHVILCFFNFAWYSTCLKDILDRIGFQNLSMARLYAQLHFRRIQFGSHSFLIQKARKLLVISMNKFRVVFIEYLQKYILNRIQTILWDTLAIIREDSILEVCLFLYCSIFLRLFQLNPDFF